MENTDTVNDKLKAKKGSEYRRNFYVFVALLLLTIIEFGVAFGLRDRGAVALLIIAMVKAGIIVQYFMHIYRLWREEDHG